MPAISERQELADAIDRLLPQTQCAKCGYPACEPYARAIADGEADINRCPPGGARVIAAIAQLLGREAMPLDAAFGAEAPRRLALIDEARCIGCTLCIQACPVDAIIGAAKQMHTVLRELCTGCELCLPPCPVDCIDMVVPAGKDAEWTGRHAAAARERFDARNARLARLEDERRLGIDPHDEQAAERRQAVVQAAVERARARLAERSTAPEGFTIASREKGNKP